VGAQREGGVPAAPSTKPSRVALHSQPKESATAGKTKSPDERRGHRSHVDANAIDPAQYAAIHRALLAGLLGNLGMRDEGNHFKVTHGRAAMIFPGSGLFDKQAAKAERKKFKGQQKPAKVSGHRTPPWIMCAEWMETQRLYARTVARIDPAWVLRLGGHLLKSSYGDPRYEEKGERVVVRERRRLYGLEIDARWVGYVRLNRKAAREIFVREALGEGLLQSQPPWFVANQKLRAEIEDRLTRQRDTSSWQVDERVAAFYERVLGDAEIGSYADLRRWLKEAHGGKDAVLYLSEPDLLRDPHALDTTLYPDAVQAADGTKLALAYTYQPGEQVDGATLKVPVGEVAKLDAAMLDWAVPGYISEKVEHLLRGLPKETRKKLHPLGPKAKELASLLEPGLAGNAKCRMQNAKEGADSDDDAVTAKANPSPSRAASLTDLDKLVGDTVRPKADERSAVTGHPDSLLAQITRHIRELYGVKVWPDEWDLDAVPAFLKPRVEVVDAKGTVVAEGRDWEKVRATYEAATRADRPGTEARAQRDAWSQAVARFTRPHLTTFSCGDHPREVTIAQVHGVPLKGFPGLSLESGEERAVTLTLFRTEAETRAATIPAFAWLVEQAVAKELIWLEKDLSKELKRVHVVASPLIPSATLQRDALAFTRRQLTAGTDPLPLQRTTFEATVRDARASLRGWPQQLTDHLQAIFAQRQRLLLIKRGYPSLREDLSALLPIDFLRVTPPDRLPHLPRSLEAMVIRAEKFARDPRKDAEKAALVARYQGGLAASPKEAPGVPSAREELRWALEEYRVSLFAQHLGTAEKVSEPRLETLRRAILGETAPPRPDPRATQATAAPEATARQRKLSHADLTALFGAKR